MTTKEFEGLKKILKDYKSNKKNDKDCQRYLSKLFRTIRQLYFFKNWAILTISSKPENNNTTIRQYKKRYVEGCACAGAALKRYRDNRNHNCIKSSLPFHL